MEGCKGIGEVPVDSVRYELPGVLTTKLLNVMREAAAGCNLGKCNNQSTKLGAINRTYPIYTWLGEHKHRYSSNCQKWKSHSCTGTRYVTVPYLHDARGCKDLFPS